jgi:hypothetical protein
MTRWAKRSLSDRAKSPRLSDFPNTLFEAFPIGFRYGKRIILKRIFLCSVDSPDPDEAMAQTRADRPELAMKLRHLEYFVVIGCRQSANNQDSLQAL